MSQPAHRDGIAVDESTYKPDLELLDRYVQFSAELQRIALLGLAAIGALLTHEAGFGAGLGDRAAVQVLFAVAAVAFATSAGAAVAHRYFGTDGVAWHVDLVRKREVEGTRKSERNRSYKLAAGCLVVAAVTLAIGVGVVAIAIVTLVLGG